MAKPVISLRLALIAGLAGVCVLIVAIVMFSSLSSKPVKLVEIIDKKFPMGQTVEALEAPLSEAAGVTRLRQGAEVEVVGIVEGDGWYQIELADKHLAYVPIATIPAAAAPVTPPPSIATPVATAPAAPAAIAPSAAPVAATPPAAPVANAATTVPAAPAPSAAPAQAATDNGPTIDLPPVVEFAEANDQLSVVSSTPLYLSPNERSPQAYMVNTGTVVSVIAKSKDGAWAWVSTADGLPAYIPMAKLGPASSP